MVPLSTPPAAALPPEIRRLRGRILRVAGRHRASHVRVFGSFARGDQRRKSDIDLLIDLPPRTSLLDLVALKMDLQDALGRTVDVLTEDGLSPYLRERILREALPL